MFDWENLRFFVAVAQTGSLSAAARQLKVDHATVGRRLSALEADLEMRLVDRLPRACQLTASGRQIVELAQRMEAEAFAIERLARAVQSPMQGKVTISVPPVLASNFFATTLGAFSQRHPGIQLAIASEAQRVSLGRREADLALRLARPDEPRNVTRKLGTMPFALYARRDYAQAVQPAEWAFIAYEARLADMPHEQWLRAAAGERPIVCEVSDISTQLAVARTGIGVAGLPVFMGDADPALQRLPWSGEAFSRDIWLVVHDDLRYSPPIRAVIDFVAEMVGQTFNS
ncbi:LysR family transcriptional regulator [Paraburkholderia bannensis]|uniref:LysR family transcriptional regulator n=1 Tax=Paraburkholderia bannensis TaxID=765414 RepID=UPI0004868666|nr:LysR family transcriptional regulator [Paraburkholderia bannensis]